MDSGEISSSIASGANLVETLLETGDHYLVRGQSTWIEQLFMRVQTSVKFSCASLVPFVACDSWYWNGSRFALCAVCRWSLEPSGTHRSALEVDMAARASVCRLTGAEPELKSRSVPGKSIRMRFIALFWRTWLPCSNRSMDALYSHENKLIPFEKTSKILILLLNDFVRVMSLSKRPSNPDDASKDCL